MPVCENLLEMLVNCTFEISMWLCRLFCDQYCLWECHVLVLPLLQWCLSYASNTCFCQAGCMLAQFRMPPPLLKNGAGGILCSGLSVCEWVSESVHPRHSTDLLTENLVNTIYQKTMKGISPNFGHKYCIVHCVSKKVPTFKLSITLSNLNRFSKFLHCWKAYEICYKTHMNCPPHLSYFATIPWEIQISANIQPIWKKMQTNCILVASNFVIRPQIVIVSVLKMVSFPILIANKIFHVTVLLVIYFCGQFVAPDICHSRHHCSVCQQSIWYSATRTRF